MRHFRGFSSGALALAIATTAMFAAAAPSSAIAASPDKAHRVHTAHYRHYRDPLNAYGATIGPEISTPSYSGGGSYGYGYGDNSSSYSQ